MAKSLLAAVLGGLVVFVWGFISWVLLPWMSGSFLEFTEEGATAVTDVLQAHATERGIYFIPQDEEAMEPGRLAVFMNVLPKGFSSGSVAMIIKGLIGNIFAAWLVFLVLGQLADQSYGRRLKVAALLGVIIGFIPTFAYWNWFEFPTLYSLASWLDAIIAWSLAGLVLARFGNRRAPDEVE